MNNDWKLAIAAAAVVVVAIVGINLLPGHGGIVAGPGPSPTPTPIADPDPSTRRQVGVEPELHRQFRSRDDLCHRRPMLRCSGADEPSRSPAPAGMPRSNRGGSARTSIGGSDIFRPLRDPAPRREHLHGRLPLARDRSSIRPSDRRSMTSRPRSSRRRVRCLPADPVTVGGHPGKKVELSIPEGLDVSTCDSDGDFSDLRAVVHRRASQRRRQPVDARRTGSTTRSTSSTSTARAR